MKETLKFDAEISKVLDLVINSLYTNRDIFLRELISNASDACDKLRFEAQSNDKLLTNDKDLKIAIQLDKKAKTLTISDNGIGMSKAELTKNLGTIAHSGTGKFLDKLKDSKNKDDQVNLIGQFGVGFYSSFMVADKVTVKTTKAGTNKSYIWQSAGEGKFSIEEAKAKDTPQRGTAITLHLKNEDQVYLDGFRVQHIINTYSNHVNFPIELIDLEEDVSGKVKDVETVNSGKAIWLRDKKDIKPEEYKDFYGQVSGQPGDPYLTIHNKLEGTFEYSSLLFVPDARPFDLFHPDRKKRVKLYVKRVFITDETVDLLPNYLRFVQGVVDSEDLPLNVSRETLQHNHQLDKIKNSLNKKILSEFKKQLKKDPEGYQKFWDNFGGVIKEGLCEGIDSKEPVFEVCLFNTSKSDKPISLDEYISNMPEKQEEIYYINAETKEAAINSPQIEGFKAKGIEVILLSDHVDDFWTNVSTEYKGKKFKSAAKSDIDLDKVSDKKTTGEDKKEEKDNKINDKTIAAFKAQLGERVKDVKTSNKLTESPVCLVTNEGEMDIRFERFLREQNQMQGTAASKTLEINPNHALIKSIGDLAAKDDTKKQNDINNTIELLYAQALIAEGESLNDKKGFSSRLNEVLNKVLAA